MIRTPMLLHAHWTIRCLTCGRTRDAPDVGIVRIAAPRRSYTLGYCSRCRWLRWCAIEPARPPSTTAGSGGDS